MKKLLNACKSCKRRKKKHQKCLIVCHPPNKSSCFIFFSGCQVSPPLPPAMPPYSPHSLELLPPRVLDSQVFFRVRIRKVLQNDPHERTSDHSPWESRHQETSLAWRHGRPPGNSQDNFHSINRSAKIKSWVTTSEASGKRARTRSLAFRSPPSVFFSTRFRFCSILEDVAPRISWNFDLTAKCWMSFQKLNPIAWSKGDPKKEKKSNEKDSWTTGLETVKSHQSQDLSTGT